MNNIDIHADDYCLSPHNSERIRELLKKGRLSSISVIPNLPCFDECMAQLRREWNKFEKKPKISVHLNIVDGTTLSQITDKDLVKGDVFHASWLRLLVLSYVPRARKRIVEELRDEFTKQIERVREAMPGHELRIDSHTHIHMVPLVFDAMMLAVDELGLGDELEFVRVPREPLFLFLKKCRFIKPKNVLKNILLKVLSKRAERILDRRGVSHGFLWGVITSGHMDRRTLLCYNADVERWANGRHIEILFHPGKVLGEETRGSLGKLLSVADRDFVTSKKRDREFEAIWN